VRDSLYIAVDLGAGSGRVFLVGLGEGELLLEEVRRFQYPPTSELGHLRWPFPKILDEIKLGLRQAAKRAREAGRKVNSIAIDGWGVDYGLIDAKGALLENPICYRDRRTQGMMEAVFNRVPRAEIFGRTGIQFLPINTIFQLYAHAQAGFPDEAKHLLLFPDLINNSLTGRTVTEYTNATTTQLLDARTGAWDLELINNLGLPSHLFTEIVRPGTDLGTISPSLTGEVGFDGIRIVAAATHDTASAVAGAPIQEDWAYISSGTWSLVGVELDKPLMSAKVASHNFTNEGGAFGTIRFLKNVSGLWILDSCLEEWKAQGLRISNHDLLAGGDSYDGKGSLIFPDDPRFFNPPSMLSAIEEQLAETNQTAPAKPEAMTLIILDSLALRYASVLRTIEHLTGRRIPGIQIVGGGSQNGYLNQTTANVTGLPVCAGPVEATVIGNALVQAIAAGRFGTLADARSAIAASLRVKRFAPRPSVAWEQRTRRYVEIEARYAD
jgi:rhamnulokinase